MVQETITSNVSDDLITLEFQRTDGTLITQFIDFRNVIILHLFFFEKCRYNFMFLVDLCVPPSGVNLHISCLRCFPFCIFICNS